MAQTTVPSKAIISSVGSVTGGGSVSVPRPVITGTADAGTTVNVYDGVRLLGTAIVNSSGAWTFTRTADLKSGAHQFAAIAIDSTGHAGTASDAVAVKIQSNAPVKPVINGGATDDHGVPLTNPTNDPRPNMSGTGTPGDTITMYDGTTPIGSTVIPADGKWTVKPSQDLKDGPHDIYVVETSPAGAPRKPWDHTPIVLDTHVPTKPVITGGGAPADQRAPLSNPQHDTVDTIRDTH